MTRKIRRSIVLLYLAWTVALASTAGSLFFSEVMEFAPCVLCWYQRIAMYPLVIIIALGIILGDWRVKLYALPFSIIGLAFSIYHNLLYYGAIPASITPCTEGIPCNAVQLELLGFLTIPLMGLVAFLIITFCLLIHSPKGE
jgi:disulfide bond formation protein DsbB